MNYNEQLVCALHEAYARCGEILSPDHTSQIIQEFEFGADIELAPDTILASVREAADRTCDSFIDNAYDSLSEWGETMVNEEVARWEARRPSAVRRKQIVQLLAQA